MNDPGTYLEHEGRPAVRFARTYAQDIALVWAAVVEPERNVHWFPSALTLEPRVGGAATFSGDPHMPDSTGVVLAWDPPTAAAFTWGDSEVHLRLEPVDDGCRLTLINVLAAPDEAARNAAGWTVCLASLSELLTDGASAGPHARGLEQDWRPHYDAYIAAGMPSGAELPH